MVYGNYNSGNGASGTGVLFTRNPANGENKLYGEARGPHTRAGGRLPKHNDHPGLQRAGVRCLRAAARPLLTGQDGHH